MQAGPPHGLEIQRPASASTKTSSLTLTLTLTYSTFLEVAITHSEHVGHYSLFLLLDKMTSHTSRRWRHHEARTDFDA
jgi:hypothetical protein